MVTLYVKEYAQVAWFGSIELGTLVYEAADVANNSFIAQNFQIGLVQDLGASPFPQFLNISDALAYYETSACASLIALVNSSYGVSIYTDYIAFKKFADWNQTAPAADNYIRNKPTALSQFTNDSAFITSSALSPYVTTTALTTTLNSYVTNVSLASTLSAYVTSTALTSTLSSYVTSSTLSSTLSSYVTNSSLSTTLASYATTSALAGKFNNPTGTTAQYVRGDGTLATLPTIATPSMSSFTPTLVTSTSAGGTQPSTTRNVQISAGVSITTAATLVSGAQGSVVLEICSTNSTTASDWIEIGRVTNSQTFSLAVAIGCTQIIAGQLTAYLPVGYFYRFRSISTTGTPTFVANPGQIVLL